MMIEIPAVLSAEGVAQVRALIDGAEWVDGNVTSGHQSALAKRNRQLPEDGAAARAAGRMVLDALGKSPLFFTAALPLKIYPPLFNTYEGGDNFGVHVDNAVRIQRGSEFRVRSDLSATLFLEDPAAYDGGELIVEGQFGAQAVKLPAGHMLLYPSSSLHRVAPVTRGRRVGQLLLAAIDDPRQRSAPPPVRNGHRDPDDRAGPRARRSVGDPADRRLSQSRSPLGGYLTHLRKRMSVTKIAMRRAWFQVHKWIGLILAAVIVPLCLSGALLVWHDPLDKLLNPQRHELTASPLPVPVEAYAVSAARELAPGERIASLRIEAGEPVLVTAAQAPVGPSTGRPQRTMIWLDPGSARLLDKAGSSDGVVRFMHQLHGSLMIPGVGRAIVGWIGVAMLVSSVSGLWLWWPVTGSWLGGLRWNRHRKLESNLHHQFGFWISLPLFVLSLTGVWISFPAFFGAMTGEQSGPPGGPAAFRARPLDPPATGLARVLELTSAAAPGTVTAVTWPTDQKPEWAVTVAARDARPTVVAVSDTTGAASLSGGETRPAGGIARTMRKLHDGTDMGIVWQIAVFLGGILPAVLAVTGVIMWARMRSRRGRTARTA